MVWEESGLRFFIFARFLFLPIPTWIDSVEIAQKTWNRVITLVTSLKTRQICSFSILESTSSILCSSHSKHSLSTQWMPRLFWGVSILASHTLELSMTWFESLHKNHEASSDHPSHQIWNAISAHVSHVVILACIPDSDHAKFPKAPLVAAAKITNLIRVIYKLLGPVIPLYVQELEHIFPREGYCDTTLSSF